MTHHYSFPATLSLAKDGNQITATSSAWNNGRPFLINAPATKLGQQITHLLQSGCLPSKQLEVGIVKPVWHDKNTCSPSSIILLPDWLIDVTRICHDLAAPGEDTANTLIHRYCLTEPSPSLLSGNICHAIAAQLAANPSADFTSIARQIFRLFGLQLATLSDPDSTGLVKTMAHHFKGLQALLQALATDQSFSTTDIIVEPTFFCPDLGMQGRPDFIAIHDPRHAPDLIELKSGRSAKAAHSTLPIHQIQTSLYRIMLPKSNAGESSGKNFLIYAGDPLPRAAPVPIHPQALSLAVTTRNTAVYMDLQMTTTQGHAAAFEKLLTQPDPVLPGYLAAKAAYLKGLYSNLSPIEKAYWHHYGASVHKEHMLVRLGDETSKSGQKVIWTASSEQKMDLGRIVAGLEMQEIIQQPGSTSVIFRLPPESRQSHAFRIGDIAILYPGQPGNGRFQPEWMLFRGSIASMSTNTIIFKLRTPQHNLLPFQNTWEWCIETDALDSSFRQLYHGLTTLMEAPPYQRQRIMGLIPPTIYAKGKSTQFRNNLSSHQKSIVQQALDAIDYYLIWGPPGTGKTSMIISELVFQILQRQQNPLLLLAYTNRAVDELCHAILAINPAFSSYLLRVGSATSSENTFRPFILDEQLKSCSNRKEIIDLIQSKRIIISTLSSIYHKQELFRLIPIETAIIDEASQVTEPLMAGILPRFKKWILVGDHLQLPAVTLRNVDEGIIAEPILQQAGFLNTQTSLFERLYLQASKQKWHHAFGMLHEQGRMHTELMAFPNKEFYQSKLVVLPGSPRQIAASPFSKLPDWAVLMKNRKIVIHCEASQHATSIKSSIDEAYACLDCTQILAALYEREGKPLEPKQIGIITPFRSQASLINQTLEKEDPAMANRVFADTIERFQGSTRDVVIISFGLQQISLLEGITSRTSTGEDRKMNVALTRARDQIILIADTRILRQNPIYERLLIEYTHLSIAQLRYMAYMSRLQHIPAHEPMMPENQECRV